MSLLRRPRRNLLTVREWSQREGDYLRCVGGNTSPKGQNANGGMVANTRRHRSEVVVIGRPK